MGLSELLTEPLQYTFMRRAVVSCVALCFGCAPVGVLLVLRRLSLMGDALSHAVLPGAAIGYIIAGQISLFYMASGGFLAGILVAFLSGLISRKTQLREDASFAGFFIISVALGVLIISTKDNAIDLMHVLLGSALAVDQSSLGIIMLISAFTLLVLAVIYRPLVIDSFDHQFLVYTQSRGHLYHNIFLLLVVLNLVSGFQALGTLLSLGLMLLPAIAARFWTKSIWSMMALSIVIGSLSGVCGTLLAYHYNLPTGPCIVLFCGTIYLCSIVFGRFGSLKK